MKKRILSILLTLCLVLALCPAAALADEPTPTLAVTVNGFEVGKTPADCTLSFASTIPGVTFSEDDIQDLSWFKYINSGDESPRAYIMDSEVFQANTRYEVWLYLDNKGVTEPPAVTVNGITPKFCSIAYRNGNPIQISIQCELGTPTPTITISGADTVCAQQDYEFTVTASEGVTLDTEFGYDTGMMGSGADLTVDEDNVGHGVMDAEWYDLDTNCFTLSAHGKTADGTPVTATKTVQVSQEHIYEDGVCGCGAVLQYTVQYDGGAEFGLYADFKTHGQDLTLRGETFKRDGYVQTGWMDKDSGAVYDLGGVYTEDEDVTLNPVWDRYVAVSVPFTTTVKLGDAVEPGETKFTLEVLGANTDEENYAGVTVSGSVTTNGAGTYSGTMTFAGPEQQLRYMLAEGALVRQVDDGAEGWTVDDTVYGLIMTQGADSSTADAAPSYTLMVVPTVKDGKNYLIDWEAIDWDQEQTGEMTFTNIYTKAVTEPTESDPGNDDTKSPQTGDSSHMMLWMALLFAGGAGVIGTTACGKKKRVK